MPGELKGPLADYVSIAIILRLQSSAAAAPSGSTEQQRPAVLLSGAGRSGDRSASEPQQLRLASARSEVTIKGAL